MARGRLVIAIDGPAGSGKSTVARKVASALRYTLVDTGALYRCVALAANQAGISHGDGASLGRLAARLQIRLEQVGSGRRVWLDGRDVSEEIHSPEISQGASRVSAHPEVRKALLQTQRDMGRDGSVVLEGRDIGTVVFPDAGVKVFLDASAEVRARRRYDELRDRGLQVDFGKTLAEVQAGHHAGHRRPEQVGPVHLPVKLAGM